MSNMASACVLLLIAAGCSAPTDPTVISAQSVVRIESLSPASGPTALQVTVHGSGFSATGNTVSFAPRGMGQSSRMPAEPSVIPNLSSTDGRTIIFSVLSVWRPACSYSPPGPCPIAHIPTAPGTYEVTVTNANGTSNAVSFVVTS